MSQQCHNMLRVSGLTVKATVPLYNLSLHVLKTFPLLFHDLSFVGFISTQLIFKIFLKIQKCARQICELTELVIKVVT